MKIYNTIMVINCETQVFREEILRLAFEAEVGCMYVTVIDFLEENIVLYDTCITTIFVIN